MIIKAETKHLDEIITIENNVFTEPWSKIHFLKDLESNVSYNIVYIDNTKCIGYLFGYLIKDEFHINNIAIKQNFQRRGIANSMLKFIIDKCKSKKINKIMLEVRCDNFAAIKLYDNLNFNMVNVRKNYYKKGKDAFLYNLEIT